MPRTHEELLDRQLNALMNTKRRRHADQDTVTNEAFERVANHQKLIKERIKHVQNDASDYSELESVKPSNQFFQLDINFEALRDYLMTLRKTIGE